MHGADSNSGALPNPDIGLKTAGGASVAGGTLLHDISVTTMVTFTQSLLVRQAHYDHCLRVTIRVPIKLMHNPAMISAAAITFQA